MSRGAQRTTRQLTDQQTGGSRLRTSNCRNSSPASVPRPNLRSGHETSGESNGSAAKPADTTCRGSRQQISATGLSP
jgi:hypothetical protein